MPFSAHRRCTYPNKPTLYEPYAFIRTPPPHARSAQQLEHAVAAVPHLTQHAVCGVPAPLPCVSSLGMSKHAPLGQALHLRGGEVQSATVACVCLAFRQVVLQSAPPWRRRRAGIFGRRLMGMNNHATAGRHLTRQSPPLAEVLPPALAWRPRCKAATSGHVVGVPGKYRAHRALQRRQTRDLPAPDALTDRDGSKWATVPYQDPTATIMGSYEDAAVRSRGKRGGLIAAGTWQDQDQDLGTGAEAQGSPARCTCTPCQCPRPGRPSSKRRRALTAPAWALLGRHHCPPHHHHDTQAQPSRWRRRNSRRKKVVIAVRVASIQSLFVRLPPPGVALAVGHICSHTSHHPPGPQEKTIIEAIRKAELQNLPSIFAGRTARSVVWCPFPVSRLRSAFRSVAARASWQSCILPI